MGKRSGAPGPSGPAGHGGLELGLQSGDSALKAAAAAPHASSPAGLGPGRPPRGRPGARKGGRPGGSAGPCLERRAPLGPVRADGDCDPGSRGVCHSAGGAGADGVTPPAPGSRAVPVSWESAREGPQTRVRLPLAMG